MLSGCYQTVDSTDIDIATKYCTKIGSSLSSIESRFNGSEVLECVNEDRAFLYSPKVFNEVF